jgi:tetratricopeptide (TPR) repeat protein
MRCLLKRLLFVQLLAGLWVLLPSVSPAAVKGWKGTVTIPTYVWEDDVNPKFWAMEGGPRLSTTVQGAIIYPYTMQDHLSRTKVDRTYQALFLENEYLKITCLPELGGRLHSVFDKTEGVANGQGREMFHLNRVIKPSMIAMRGAWISGGVEWNSGPHGHTVTILSPVDALIGQNTDGSAFLEISNQEKLFRTRWTARVTLHPGRTYLDEQIRIFNPTDGMHPYYFWNCTAFPCRAGTRFIYPMSLGTDHLFRQFFSWPIYRGRDISWLKNYPQPTSIFAVRCQYDFFGAYDVDANRGIVQVANHYELGGKKAWTWGTSDFGRVCQENLTDEDGAYIEVQSGPLPTQSDYGMLGPREEVSWREWWYPVHGLGDGFEYATRDVAAQTTRNDGKLQLRLLATGEFSGATCALLRKGQELLVKQIDLSPEKVQEVTLSETGQSPIDVVVKAKGGPVLASFTTPLPIPKTSPPEVSTLMDRPDDQLTTDEKYLKGRKYDRGTQRRDARAAYEKVLAEDPGYLLALRALAVLDLEAGLYPQAIERLQKALNRDSDDGLSWYFLGVCRLRTGENQEALRCGYRATRCPGTVSLGYDLVGRAYMRSKQFPEAVQAFEQAAELNPRDVRASQHLMLALYRRGATRQASLMAQQRIAQNPTDLVSRALVGLQNSNAMYHFVQDARELAGEDDFELLEVSLVFAEVGLTDEAAKIVAAACVGPVGEDQLSPLPLYYLAYYASQSGDDATTRASLNRAAGIYKDFVFPSRPEAVEVLRYALGENPADAHAHLHLGNLYADLGRLKEAAAEWEQAAKLKASLSIALRNLGVYSAAVEKDLPKAKSFYRKAIAARPEDQTLYRDLAEILIADGRRPEAIKLMETMPFEKMRRADIIIMLAEAYTDEQKWAETIKLLESTPYFVNWEGQTITWVLFSRAHIERGRQRLENKDFQGALEDFEAALSYPRNLGVGRSNTPQEAPAQYWKGKALEGLGRVEDAKAAWREGAAGRRGSAQQNEYRQRCSQALSATQSG